MFDKKILFQRQAEECRELATHAINDEDRRFWLHAAERWEAQVRQSEKARPAKA
jgi:gluconate kinase